MSCTSNNGYFSEHFVVERSCHQGCPLAPELYLLCSETMARFIKSQDNIQGIHINQLQQLIAQFADDTQLFLSTKQFVENALMHIEAHTGLKVNYEKTCICQIGEVEKFMCIQNLVWDPGKIEVLGIDIQQTSTQQCYKILSKARNILNLWHH